jgi:hypothetical protein
MISLSRVLMVQSQYAEAGKLFETAFKRVGNDLPQENDRIALYHSWYGKCLLQTGDLNNAEDQLLRGFRTSRRLLGGKHEQTIDAINLLIALYEVWGKQADADRYRQTKSDMQKTL